jgi:2-aminoadipate transaminase
VHSVPPVTPPLQLDRISAQCGLDCLRATMPEGVRWSTPGGGPILWLEFPGAVDLGMLQRSLAARGAHIALSNDAFFGVPHLHGIRLGYAFLPPEPLSRALALLADHVRRQLSIS